MGVGAVLIVKRIDYPCRVLEECRNFRIMACQSGHRKSPGMSTPYLRKERSETTLVDRAIAFVKERGSVTRAELAGHIERPANQLLGYLAHPLRDGRLDREGDSFIVGNAVERSPRSRNTGMRVNRSARSRQIAGSDATVLASLCVGELQLIEWATGNITIRANGNVVDLSPSQAAALETFLSQFSTRSGRAPC